MNKLKMLGLLLFVGTNLIAQNLPSPKEIKEKIEITIMEINRVEKYGWDNLEIIYQLKNATNYDIQKIDFDVHLADAEGVRIGTIEVHAFRIPKNSERTIKFAEVSSDYVNAKFEGSSAEITNIDVITDSETGSIVTIKPEQIKN